MAQKAAKQTARRNLTILNRTHLISLGLHTFFLFLRAFIFRSTFTRSSILLYSLLSAPALGIEFWFERIGRPTYGGNDLKSSGEDLEAKGLTEWMWDVLYWTWGCIGLAGIVGDRAWWLYVVVPLYSGWLAWTTFGSVRQGLAGAMGGSEDDPAVKQGSRRQQKLEKRGGQKIQYR